MNFFRRPGISQLLGQSNAPRKGARRHGNADMDPTLRSSIDNVMDQFDAQVADTEDIISEALKAGAHLRKQFEETANAAKDFAAVLARFSDRSGNLLNSSCLASHGGNAQPAAQADINGDLAVAQAEHQKGVMLMAASHQLAKFYMLMAAVNQDFADVIDKEFETPVAERQVRHGEKLDAWYEEYQETVRPVMDQIHHRKMEVSKADGDKQIEIYDEISNFIRQLTVIKRAKLRDGLKQERHHYVHITHRLQNAFRRQLPLFRTLYMQEIECIPDLLETAPFAAIIARHPKPSQLYLRLKRPQDMDASPDAKRLEAVTEEAENHESSDQWQHSKLLQDEPNRHHKDVLSAPEIMRELEETEKLITIPLTPVLNHAEMSSELPEAEMSDERASSGETAAQPIGESAIILYDYAGNGENDLTVRRNDHVKIVQVEGEWAYALKSDVNGDPDMGWIPLSFTTLGTKK